MHLHFDAFDSPTLAAEAKPRIKRVKRVFFGECNNNLLVGDVDWDVKESKHLESNNEREVSPIRLSTGAPQ